MCNTIYCNLMLLFSYSVNYNNIIYNTKVMTRQKNEAYIFNHTRIIIKIYFILSVKSLKKM